MRIVVRLPPSPGPRNGHVPALIGRKAGPHTKTTKAKRKADKMALRSMLNGPCDHGAHVCVS